MENKKIICLDDSPTMLEMMKITLEEDGYEVHTATSWPEINQFLFKDAKIRLLLCDVMMPGLPGNKLCKLLKETIPNLKVFLFSSLSDKELESLAREYNADGWICKSSDPATWSVQIENCIFKKSEKH